MLFQIQLTPQDQSFTIAQMTYFDAYVLIALDVAALIVLLFSLVLLVRLFVRRTTIVPRALQKTILLVTLPKEGHTTKEGESSQPTAEVIRNYIATAESWLSSLGGLRAERGIKTWFFGRNDHFSFEIVSHQGLISFYVVVPNYLRQYMEQQLLAQYPEAGVTEVDDYNLFALKSEVVTAYLKLTRHYSLPIRTYQSLTADSLTALTNSLSKVNPDEGIAVQIVARSAKRAWHKAGNRLAREMQKGKTFNQAVSDTSMFSWGKVLGVLGSSTKKKKKEEDQPKRQEPSPMQQESIKGLEEKTAKAGLDCNIRIVVAARDKTAAQAYLAQVADSFNQFNFYEYGNSLRVIKEKPKRLVGGFIYRHYEPYQHVLLNAEELATVFHLPSPYIATPNIRWLLARKLPMPPIVPSDGLLLGENVFRGLTHPVYMAPEDRRRHMYIIGMTGTGKSTLMENLIKQDIASGNGVCVIDPHGSLVENILPSIPKSRMDDVILFDPSDTERPVGLNMLEASTPEQMDFATQEMIAIFYKLVTDPSMIGPMFEHSMRNAMLTLMADKKSPGTMVDIPRIFTDKAFQRYKLQFVTDPIVRSFWEKEMSQTSDFHKSEMLGYLISKVSRFIESEAVRNIIGQPASSFNFREVMDKKKILLVNLSKGKLGEVNSNLLGLIMVSKLQMAALSRADAPENQRNDFYLYIDEFQNFVTDSISTILAEARKYRLNLTLAHQYLGQLSSGGGVEGKNQGSRTRDSIFGNVGTMVAFRIGVEDAEVISKQMAPVVNEYDLMNVEKYNAYVRLLVDNQPTKAFSLRTLPPTAGRAGVAEDIKQFSRMKYGRDKREVEAYIMASSKLGQL